MEEANREQRERPNYWFFAEYYGFFKWSSDLCAPFTRIYYFAWKGSFFFLDDDIYLDGFQALIYFYEPIEVEQDQLIEGSVTLTQSKENRRFMNIHLEYTWVTWWNPSIGFSF